MAFGRDPVLSQCTSYRRSATSGVVVFNILTDNGFTVYERRKKKEMNEIDKLL